MLVIFSFHLRKNENILALWLPTIGISVKISVLESLSKWWLAERIQSNFQSMRHTLKMLAGWQAWSAFLTHFMFKPGVFIQAKLLVFEMGQIFGWLFYRNCIVVVCKNSRRRRSDNCRIFIAEINSIINNYVSEAEKLNKLLPSNCFFREKTKRRNLLLFFFIKLWSTQSGKSQPCMHLEKVLWCGREKSIISKIMLILEFLLFVTGW